MKLMALVPLMLSTLILTGCEWHAYARGESQAEAPPQITGAGGGPARTSRVEVGVEACSAGHPACKPKPTKEELKKDLRKFNLLLQQQNTHSVPVNNKLEVKVFDGSATVTSKVFDAVVVGNQIRLAQPDQVADWVHPYLDNGNSLKVFTYLTSTGFESENIVVNVRYDTQIVAAATLLIEIDCGSDHPWGEPAQGCVILP